MYYEKTILITGGTGSLGKSFAKYLLANHQVKKLIIFSRDEFKQLQLQRELNDPKVRYFLGDVRDQERLDLALHGVDIVIHAAALKQVPTLEYNPFEAVQTNILGSQNVIKAALKNHVKKVLLISTDKAAQPVNLYGSTKLCAEKLFVSGNAYSDGHTRFSVVRYGNVLGSRGSVVENLLNNRNIEKIQITDLSMTRFWITLSQCHELINYALANMEGGEIFIPQLPSMRLVDLFQALAPQAQREVVGIRPGEKLHELLMTEQEGRHAVSLDCYYVVLPEFLPIEQSNRHVVRGEKLAADFSYKSNLNSRWLNEQELRILLNL